MQTKPTVKKSAVKSAPKKKLTAQNLKEMLWDNAQKVKAGKMDPAIAGSIAIQSREIIRANYLQLKVAGQSEKRVPKEVLNFTGYKN